MEELKISAIKAGNSIEGDFVLLKVQKEGKNYHLLMGDKSGSIRANLPDERADVELVAGKPVHVQAFAGIENGQVVLQVSKLAVSETAAQNLINGLPKEEVSVCRKTIGQILSLISDKGLHAIIEKIFNDGIAQMEHLPATLSEQGRYAGAMLHQTAMVSVFAYQHWKLWEQYKNSLYGRDVKKDVLLGASLLHLVSRATEYTDYPWKRSLEGVQKGSSILITEMVRSAAASVEQSGTIINQELIDKVLHCIAVVHSQGKMKAISKEAVILRNCVDTYRDMDVMDSEAKNLLENGADGIAYSKRAGGFIEL